MQNKRSWKRTAVTLARRRHGRPSLLFRGLLLLATLSTVLIAPNHDAQAVVGDSDGASFDPTSDASTLDFAEETVTPDGAWLLGPYAAAVIQARRSIGIIDTVEDLSQAQDDAVADLADAILLNWLQTATSPTLNSVNDIIDQTLDNTAPAEGNLAVPTAPQGGYGGLNEQEKRVCRRHPWDCWRGRDTAPDAVKWAGERFPNETGHNDIRDAFRHCVWNALMTKRANADFAKKFGDAHEYGDADQPVAERDMDLFNNAHGRSVGTEGEGRSDGWAADRCEALANDGTLQTFPVVKPKKQVTNSSGSGSYSLTVPRDPSRATTLSMYYGDGFSESRSITQGSGYASFSFSHTFSGTGTYEQTARIVETGATAGATTTRVASPPTGGGPSLGASTWKGKFIVSGSGTGGSGTVTGWDAYLSGQMARCAQQPWTGTAKTHAGPTTATPPHNAGAVIISVAKPTAGSAAECNAANNNFLQNGTYNVNFLNTGWGEFVGTGAARDYKADCMTGGHGSTWELGEMVVNNGAGGPTTFAVNKPWSEVTDLAGMESAICISGPVPTARIGVKDPQASSERTEGMANPITVI